MPGYGYYPCVKSYGPAWIINFQYMCNTLCRNDSSRKDKLYAKI